MAFKKEKSIFFPFLEGFLFGRPKHGGETVMGPKSLTKQGISVSFGVIPLSSRLVLSATKTAFAKGHRNKGYVKCQKQPRYGSQSGLSPYVAIHICIYIYICISMYVCLSVYM